MRDMIRLLSTGARHRLAQIKAYMSVVGDSLHPLHGNICDAKGTGTERGGSWIAQEEKLWRGMDLCA